MMNEETTTDALSLISNGTNPLAPKQQVTGVTMNLDVTREIYQIAQGFSQSELVPAHYRGKPNSSGHANCFVALTMGFELGIAPFQALSHIVVIAGKPALDGQLAIALGNRRAPIVGPIRYEEKGEGDKQECVAWAIDKETKERVEYKLTIADAKKAGWFNKSHSHWNKDPKLMLRYRSATYLIRTYYPDALMGLHTREEMQDMAAAQNTKAVSDINETLGIEKDLSKESESEVVTKSTEEAVESTS